MGISQRVCAHIQHYRVKNIFRTVGEIKYSAGRCETPLLFGKI